MSIATKAYDAVTALGSGMLSLISPGRAAWYRTSRNLYRSYLAGEAAGVDQNFRPRLRSADADIKRANALVVARCRD